MMKQLINETQSSNVQQNEMKDNKANVWPQAKKNGSKPTLKSNEMASNGASISSASTPIPPLTLQ